MDTQKPDDIPDDIWKLAEEHRQLWARGPSTIKETVARAIAAERGRNAWVPPSLKALVTTTPGSMQAEADAETRARYHDGNPEV